ncbi:MAG: hypothetical protein QOJ79_2841 [Actinomycetota bacterium]|jgi:hypothetical protein|nr:hypothetical protein [Actinomycetota bacterium]
MKPCRIQPWPVVALGLALALSACGSTVQQQGTGAAGQAEDALSGADGLGGAAAPNGGTTGAATGGLTAPGTGSTGGSSLGTTATGGGATGAAGTAGAVASGTGESTTSDGTVLGPGVTATTIAVGLPYTTNAQAAGDALGVVAGGGDQRAQWNVIIDDLNKHAHGILGRKIVPVYHATDATSSDTYDAQEQAACSDYFEDHKVFAVLNGSVNGVLRACAEKAHAVNIYEDLSDASAPTFRAFPHYVEVGNLRLDRMAANWPALLAAQSYFTKWDTSTGAPGVAPVKVGVLALEEPASRYAIDHALKPALAAAGYGNPDVVTVQSPKSTQDSGSTISAIQAAVLKFRSDGVTHFLPLDIGAGLALYFGLNAGNQNYYPRYGLTTSDGVQTLIDQASFPKAQLNGAVGYGWYPLIDLSVSRNPDNGPYSNASRRTCLKLMSDAGQNLSTAVEKRSAVFECDEMHFLKAALEWGGPSVTQASFLAGVAKVGTTFAAGNTFSTVFGSSLHDGVSSARLFAYDTKCGCFNYTSGVRPLS